VFAKKSNGSIIATLVFTVFIWGGSNAGTKYLVGFWPPGLVGSTRLLCAGLILMGLLRWTRWLGTRTPLSAAMRRELWWRGTLSLAVYIAVFNWALHFTSASHVALYLGASPVWTLLWEERPSMTLRSLQRYGAAGLAAAGAIVSGTADACTLLEVSAELRGDGEKVWFSKTSPRSGWPDKASPIPDRGCFSPGKRVQDFFTALAAMRDFSLRMAAARSFCVKIPRK